MIGPRGDAANPMRLAVAAGRPILVCTCPEAVPGVVEAARVAGRLADLLVVQSEARAFSAGWPLAPWERLASEESLRGVTAYETRRLDHVPFADLDALPPPGRPILVFSSPGAGGFSRESEAAWSLLAGRSHGGGSPVPSRFEIVRSIGGLALFVVLEGTEPGTFEDPVAGFRYTAHGPAGDAADAWDRALAAHAAGLDVAVRPGFAAIGDGRRFVGVAETEADRTGPVADQRRYMVCEVDAKGMLLAVERSLPRDRGCTHEEALAWQAWRAGIGGCEPWLPDAIGGEDWTEFFALDQRATLGWLCGDGLPGRIASGAEALRREVLARVDIDLLRAIAGVDCEDRVLGHVAGDPGGRGARRQFCLVWRALSDLLLDDGVRACVDSGRPVVPAVAAALGIGAGVARRLVGRDLMPWIFEHCRVEPGTGDRGWDGSYAIGAMMRAFGPDRLPGRGDAAAWDGFARCLDYVGEMLAAARADTAAIPAGEVAALALGGGRDWAARAAAVEGLPPPRDVGDAVGAFGDWLSEVGRGREPPVGMGDDPGAAAFRILARHGSLGRLAAASDAWHATPALASRSGGLPLAVRWPVPFDPVDLGDGWTAHALGGVGELVDEGAPGPDADGMDGLAHCVATYSAKAFSGSSVIVSIRHAEGGIVRRVSTVEILPVGYSAGRAPSLAVAQHRGRRNADPCAEADRRLGRLLWLVDTGAVALRPEAFEGRSDMGRGADRDGVLLQAWRPILPRSLRDCTLDELMVLARNLGGAA